MRIFLIYISIFGFLSCKASNIVTETQLAGTPAQKLGKYYILRVRGVYGDLCQDEIEKASKYLQGVHFAYWIQGEQILLLDFDKSKTNIDAISMAIAKQGYDTERHKADNSIYEYLGHQCKYR